MTITLKLTPALYANLRVLVTAGAKSPQSGEDGIMAAAQLLGLMTQAASQAQQEQQARQEAVPPVAVPPHAPMSDKFNGHAAEHAE